MGWEVGVHTGSLAEGPGLGVGLCSSEEGAPLSDLHRHLMASGAPGPGVWLGIGSINTQAGSMSLIFEAQAQGSSHRCRQNRWGGTAARLRTVWFVCSALVCCAIGMAGHCVIAPLTVLASGFGGSSLHTTPLA